MLERVAITGATGFLGGHLARQLIQAGNQPVLLARAPRATRLLAGLGPNLLWRTADVTNPESVRRALAETRPEVLFHLAGTRGRDRTGQATRSCLDVNVCATVRLLELAQQAGVRRIVLLGSADVFGDQPGPHHEQLPLQPRSPYGISMAAATLFAQALHQETGCPVVVLRAFTVYGPGQPADMFLSQAIRAALRGSPFAMTHGRQRRDFVFVTDVVEALLAAAQAPNVEGQVLHIGSGEAHALRDVARLIWDLTASAAPLLIGARPAPAAELHDTWADVTLAHQLLSWRPHVALAEGLRDVIPWEREELTGEKQACPTK